MTLPDNHSALPIRQIPSSATQPGVCIRRCVFLRVRLPSLKFKKESEMTLMIRNLLIGLLALVVSACSSSATKEVTDLGSGKSANSSPVGGVPKSPAASTSVGAVGPSLTTQPAPVGTAESVAGNSPSDSNSTTESHDTAASIEPSPASPTPEATPSMPEATPTTPAEEHAETHSEVIDGHDSGSVRNHPATASSDSALAARNGPENRAVVESNQPSGVAHPTSGAPSANSPQSSSLASPDADAAIVAGSMTAKDLSADPLLAERSLYYDFDKYDIKEQFVALITAHANFLTNHPSVKIFVEGNCDDRGSPEYNMVLGQRRAESVQKALIALGALPRQIESVSFGAERPVARGHDEESWAKNRRSDIVYSIKNQ